MAVPRIAPGKYTNITARYLREPTPGGDEENPWPIPRPLIPLDDTNPHGIANDYLSFHTMIVEPSVGHTIRYGAWSQAQQAYQGKSGGSVTLHGYIPIQLAMGIYVGRRLEVTKTWSHTMDGTPYTINFTPLKLLVVSIPQQIAVKENMKVTVNCVMDYRTGELTRGKGPYNWFYQQSKNPNMDYGYSANDIEPSYNQQFVV